MQKVVIYQDTVDSQEEEDPTEDSSSETSSSASDHEDKPKKAPKHPKEPKEPKEPKKKEDKSEADDILAALVKFTPKNPAKMAPGVSKKNFKEGSLTFKAQATFRAATTLEIAAEKPHDIPLHDWIKVNVAEFYNSTVTLSELLTETCTKSKCPEMTAGQEYVYLWAEDEYARNPTAMDAPEYISRLLVWAEKVIQNQEVFPEDDRKPPANFADVCDKLCRRLLRAPMHYYYHHGKELKEIGYEEFLDRLTLRYCIFALRFRLFKTKDRVLPILEVLKEKLPAQYVEMLMMLPDGIVK